MVVCAMQSFASEQPLKKLNGCRAQSATAKSVGIVDKQVQGDDNDGVEEDDREEGEIVDEFEMIISSEDEEFKLRARIQQLEDKNNDLEKISVISANLANQYNYPTPQRLRLPNYEPICVLSDVSSLSEPGEEEESQPRKHHKYKSKRLESKRYGYMAAKSNSSDYKRNPLAVAAARRSSSRRKRRHEHSHHNHHHYQKHNADNMLLDSLDSVTDEEIGEYEAEDENDQNDAELEQLRLSRDKLRFALARHGDRDIMPKHSLKERLWRITQTPSPQSTARYAANGERRSTDAFKPLQEQQLKPNFQFEPPDEDEEKELRLIALKSVIMKKHYARKKRDAERAYSPTDMINRVHPAVANDCEIDDLMEISPAASPERALSPQEDSEEAEERAKPIDMELVDTDSDQGMRKEEEAPWMDTKDKWPVNWQPPLPLPMVEATPDSWRPFFVPNSSLPPVSMPIVIDDDDEEEEARKQQLAVDDDDDEVPPPPPPFHIPLVMLYEDENARDAEHSNQGCCMDIQSISMDNSRDSSDEEARTLRALLLSKIKTPPVKTEKEEEEQEVKPMTELEQVKSTDSDDPEELRLLLLSSIAGKRKSNSGDEAAENESVLKQALRRFQLQLEANAVNSEAQEAVAAKAEEDEDKAEDEEPLAELIKEATEEESCSIEITKEIATAVEEESSIEIAKETVTSMEELPAKEIPPEIPAIVEPATAPIIAKPIIKAKSPTFSLQSLSPLPVIKIVKPNKVINKSAALKRKIANTQEALAAKRPATLLTKEDGLPLHLGRRQTNGLTRLITAVDASSIKVNRLIISLGDSSTDSELDNEELDELRGCHNYSEIASPLSLAMDSASNSTTRSNTPNSEILEAATSGASVIANLRRTVINEHFEKKLDDFLKQARSKAVPPEATAKSAKSGVAEKKTLAGGQAKITPVAVRHLPVASQKEYLRLIERMQLLESKRKEAAKPAASVQVAAKRVTPSTAPVAPTTTILEAALATTTAAKTVTTTTAAKKTTTTTAAKTKDAATKTKTQALIKPPASNKVPRKVTATKTTTKTATTAKTSATTTANKAQAKAPAAPAKSEKPSTSKAATATKAAPPTKESRLKAFENSFLKIGGSMISNLDKSLHMVEEARKSKIARLRCSQRLKELSAEMLAVKQVVKLEEAKLARIQPEIQASHEIIISLKQKRNKLYKAAVDLGRGLQGADYRLLDEGKADITRKSSQLTKEIRLYNSIVKYDDAAALLAKAAAEAEAEASSSSTPTEAASSSSTQTEATPELLSAESTPCVPPDEPPPGGQLSETVETEAATATTNCDLETAADKEEEKVQSVDSVARVAEEDVAVATDDCVVETITVAAKLSPKRQAYTGATYMKELREQPLPESTFSSSSSAFREYNSPLWRNHNSHVDVNATMCPFELMGRCEDVDCSYMHLTRSSADSTDSEAAVSASASSSISASSSL